MGLWNWIDSWGWKKEVRKCFEKNYPQLCPINSPYLVSDILDKGGLRKRKKSLNYCKYYLYCKRHYIDKVKK